MREQVPGVMLPELGGLPLIDSVTIDDPGADEVRVRIIVDGCDSFVSLRREACAAILLHRRRSMDRVLIPRSWAGCRRLNWIIA